MPYVIEAKFSDLGWLALDADDVATGLQPLLHETRQAAADYLAAGLRADELGGDETDYRILPATESAIGHAYESSPGSCRCSR